MGRDAGASRVLADGTAIPHFDQAVRGGPRVWPMSSAQFKTLLHNIVPYDTQRLAILREMLGPSVRARIAETFNTPELYHKALRELDHTATHTG